MIYIVELYIAFQVGKHERCWVKLSLVNLPSINCQPGCVNFELLHYMCRQGSLNARADKNSSLLSNENEINETIAVLDDLC